MPTSRSFPSGHTASAFAFATGVGHVLPSEAVPLRVLAAAVGYSRVHAGVHFPGDVLVGALIGTSSAQLTVYAIERRAR
jgi:undecaprenyl-diphosphatase